LWRSWSWARHPIRHRGSLAPGWRVQPATADTFAGGNELTRLPQHLAVAVAWLWAGGDRRVIAEDKVMRRLFFYYGFDWRMGVPGAVTNQKPQAEEWYRDGWSCKAARIFAARVDRHETYDARFRLWHWRLAAEQLVFSHQLTSAVTGEPLYLENTTRTLLACGYDDTGGVLCSHARAVADKMTRTPGKAVFLHDTGHSIASEHPAWLAGAIVDFLAGR
jgi:pimeloyl-ACP methyl ester carboxylesterase